MVLAAAADQMVALAAAAYEDLGFGDLTPAAAHRSVVVAVHVHSASLLEVELAVEVHHPQDPSALADP